MANRIVGFFLDRACEVIGSRPAATDALFLSTQNHRILYVNFLDREKGGPTSMQIVDDMFYRSFEVGQTANIATEFYENVDPKIETVKIKRS